MNYLIFNEDFDEFLIINIYGFFVLGVSINFGLWFMIFVDGRGRYYRYIFDDLLLLVFDCLKSYGR